MSEKRLDYDLLWNNYYQVIELDDGDTDYLRRLSPTEIIKRLNEQQATIQRMKHSLNTIYKAFEKHYGYDMRNAVWLIDEISYDEFEDKLHIAETDGKNRKEASMYWKKKCDEQQATIKAKNEYQQVLEEKIRRLKNRIKILEKAEGWQN